MRKGLIFVVVALLLGGCVSAYVDPYGTTWVWDSPTCRYVPLNGDWYGWNPRYNNCGYEWGRGWGRGVYNPQYPYWRISWIRNPYAIPPPPPRGQEWRFESGQWRLYHLPWGGKGPSIPRSTNNNINWNDSMWN